MYVTICHAQTGSFRYTLLAFSIMYVDRRITYQKSVMPKGPLDCKGMFRYAFQDSFVNVSELLKGDLRRFGGLFRVLDGT